MADLNSLHAFRVEEYDWRVKRWYSRYETVTEEAAREDYAYACQEYTKREFRLVKSTTINEVIA